MAVSEDVGTSTISIASRASTVREAFIYVAVNSTGEISVGCSYIN